MGHYQVVILAGGLGTRLRPLTDRTPKVLIPIAGRPFISWQLDLLADNQIDEVVICVGFLAEQVQAAVKDIHKSIPIRYSYESPDKLLGTAGAIKNAEPFLNSTFGVLYGDSYLEFDYRKAFDFHRTSNLPATMVVWKNESSYIRSNVALSDNGKRVSRYEKATYYNSFNYVDFGFSIFDKQLILSCLPEGRAAALDQLQRELSIQNLMGAYEVDRRFYEIGSKIGLSELEQYLLKRQGREHVK